MKAFGLFSANNYRAAAEAFSSFAVSFPESDYTENARYWLGECYFSEGRFLPAIEAFSTVYSRLNPGKKAPDALLKTGLSWYSLNEAEKGRATMRTLVEKFPGSEAAAKAREYLNRQ
jgi:tol-pal system protein YbgF